jgi:hypothetical protein
MQTHPEKSETGIIQLAFRFIDDEKYNNNNNNGGDDGNNNCSREHNNESLGSIKFEEFLDKVSVSRTLPHVVR